MPSGDGGGRGQARGVEGPHPSAGRVRLSGHSGAAWRVKRRRQRPVGAHRQVVAVEVSVGPQGQSQALDQTREVEERGGSMRMTTGPLLGQGPRRCRLWRTGCHQALVWGSLAVMPEGISSTAGDNINIHIGLRLRFWGNVSDRGSQYFLSEVASGPERPSMSH